MSFRAGNVARHSCRRVGARLIPLSLQCMDALRGERSPEPTGGPFRQAGPHSCAVGRPGVFKGGGPMSDVTVVLDAIKSGDPEAPAQLLPLVYEELRRL